MSIRPVDVEKLEGTGNGSELTFELVRSGDLNQQSGVNVTIGLQGRTPQASFTDTLWNTGVFTHVFGVGQSSILLTVPVVGDSTNEADEPIVIEVLANNTYQNVVIVDKFAQGLILNDDGPTPPLVTARPIAIRETDANQTVTLRVDLDHTTTAPVTLNYQVYTNGASSYPTVAGTDYAAASGTLEIPAGADHGLITVSVLGDNVAEGLEVINLRLTNLVNGYFGRSVTTWNTGIVVVDDDSSLGMPSAVEALGPRAIDLGTISPYSLQTIYYQLDAGSPTHIYKVRFDEAMSLDAFGAAPRFVFDSAGELIYTAAENVGYLEVDTGASTGIGQNVAFQPGEYFLVLEQAPGGTGAGNFDLIGRPLDSNAPLAWIRLHQAGEFPPGAGSENNFAPFAFSVQISRPLTEDITFNVTLRGISATPGQEYVDRTYPVTVRAGNVSTGATFVFVNDDAVYEGTETFELVLASMPGVVLPNGATEYTRTLTLLDNEVNPNPQIEIRAVMADRAESSATSSFFEFEIFRPQAFAAGPASVQWIVFGDGTAPADAADFAGSVLPSGTVDFLAEETTKLIRVEVLGDNLPEAHESFSVMLRNPSTGFGLGNAVATGIIRNDDGIYTPSYLGPNDAQAGTSYVMSAEEENFLLLGGADADVYGNGKFNLISGNNAANKLFGFAGDDTIFGYRGNDILDGGGGVDELAGGLNNDSYIVESAADLIVEAQGEGTDTVFASVTYALSAGQEIETLTLTGTVAINGVGNEFSNRITGNAASNLLNGMGGGDILAGGAGNDTYITAGGDAITEAANSGTDTVRSSVAYTLGVNLENLVLTGAAAVGGRGNTLANVLDGSTNTAANTLTGLTGNDSYFVGVGDKVVEAATGGIDTVRSSTLNINLASFANVENIVLFGSAARNAVGNGAANTLIGNTVVNSLNGLGGNDFLAGGLGNDTLTGGGGNDVFVFNTAPNSTTNKDLIADFTAINDTIRLENTGVGLFNLLPAGALGAAGFKANASGIATDSNDRIVYNTVTGALFYDVNGNAAGGATQFATLSGHPTISHLDFFVV